MKETVLVSSRWYHKAFINTTPQENMKSIFVEKKVDVRICSHVLLGYL